MGPDLTGDVDCAAGHGDVVDDHHARTGSDRCGQRCDQFRYVVAVVADWVEHLDGVDAQHVHVPGGHVGAMVSSAASRKLWPTMRAFWAARDGVPDPGDGVVLEVSAPRIPCTTFAGAMGERGWIKTFTKAAKPGAYLRVLSPGTVQAGDAISVIHRPDHAVTVALVFRAETLEPELLPQILAADALPDEAKEMARRRIGSL